MPQRRSLSFATGALCVHDPPLNAHAPFMSATLPWPFVCPFPPVCPPLTSVLLKPRGGEWGRGLVTQPFVGAGVA